MLKTSLGKYKRPSKNSVVQKKQEKNTYKKQFRVAFASNIRCINPHTT